MSRALASFDTELMTRPKDAQEWTEGKALMATGSPFDPVELPGSSAKYIVAECNNVSKPRTQVKGRTLKGTLGPHIPWSRTWRYPSQRFQHDRQDDRRRIEAIIGVGAGSGGPEQSLIT